MNKFKAILFDVDGTLIDTSDLIYEAFNHTLKEHGFKPVTKEDIDKVMGTALPKCYEVFAPDGDHELMFETHHKFQIENINLSRPFSDAKLVLTTLKDMGIKLGAVTNRSKTVIKTLQEVGLEELLSVVITPDDVTNPKPDKEPLLKALSILGVDKKDALYVGDTQTDIQTARNTGVVVVGVATSLPEAEMLSYQPDYLVKNLTGILKLVDKA